MLWFEISMHSLLDGAARAIGTVAVIEVFRAFTTAAVALANGASRIVMVRTVEEAMALRDAGAGAGQICMGEVHGRAPDGFDFGNSPFEISSVDFHSSDGTDQGLGTPSFCPPLDNGNGKTIVQRASAGT